jgi:DNA-3-methyladenine glycosylase II
VIALNKLRKDYRTIRLKHADHNRLDDRRLAAACLDLAAADPYLGRIFASYGTPPLWDRPLGFGTLLNIILEQQVSLASAKACFDKLAARLGDVTPAGLLTLDDAELKAIGFSRQKTAYARHLSEAVVEDRIDLERVHGLPDDQAKAELIKLKGIGEWTSDVYLLMAMLRPDVMPRGDIALHAAYQKLTCTEKRPNSDEFIAVAERWRPFRSVAARLLWHFYLSERRLRLHKPARK